MPVRGDGYAGAAPEAARPPHAEPSDALVLVLGFPAPAAAAVVERLLSSDARTIACVVPGDRLSQAMELHRDARDAGRLLLFEGDAAAPGLGLAHTAWRILDTADEIHAVATPGEIAAGHVQDFADECPRLRELHLLPQTSADAAPLRPKAGALRHLRGALSARPSVREVATAVAVGAAALVAPAVRAVGRDLLNVDLDAAFSWDDVARDLEPGVGRAA